MAEEKIHLVVMTKEGPTFKCGKKVSDGDRVTDSPKDVTCDKCSKK